MKHLTEREESLYKDLKRILTMIKDARISIADVELMKIKTKAIEITEKQNIK